MAPSTTATTTATTALSNTEAVTLCAITTACAAVLYQAVREGAPIVTSLALSGFAFAATYPLVLWTGPNFMRAGLKGVDLSKPHRREIPECAGAVCAVVYLLIVILFIPAAFLKDIVAATTGGGNRDVVLEVHHHVNQGRFLHKFPHDKLASYLSAIMSLQSIAILGLGDDLFDIRWRHKILMPLVAAIPLLVVYFVDFGVTAVVVPLPLQQFLGGRELIHLEWLYYAYMGALAIFCPNSINIIAGINGIEVIQSIVIALLLVCNDVLYLTTRYPHPATESHLFSLFFLLPFLGVSLALLLHNKYPARVFVGDTYCYFAGMVFVVVSILGHFSKTLLLVLVPQIFNFVYSSPQLFHWIPCPRHRLPHYNAHKDVLEPRMMVWAPDAQPHWTAALWMRPLGKLGLIKITYDTDDKGRELFKESSNLTIINLYLVWRGPLHEKRLAWELAAWQLVIGACGLVVRHSAASLVYREDNWGLGGTAAV